MTERDVPPIPAADLSPGGVPTETGSREAAEMPSADLGASAQINVPEEPVALGISDTPDEAGEQEGPDALIAAFFQSMFDLSFDGRPHAFSPGWDYRPQTAGESVREEVPTRRLAQSLTRRLAQRPAPASPPAPSRAASRGWPRAGSARACWPGSTTRRRWPKWPSCHSSSPAVPPTRTPRAAGIARTIGLDRAVRTGLIEGYVVCWPAGRYPKTARSIRLRVPGGRRQRGRALGGVEAPLRAWIDAMKRV